MIIKTAYQQIVEKNDMIFEAGDVFDERIKLISKWLTESNRAGLLLYGTKGNGKTTLAKAIVTTINALYQQTWKDRKSVLCITAMNLVKVSTKAENFEKIKETPLLFIDDMGTETLIAKNFGNEFSPMVELICERYDNKRFTIITSNLNDEQISQRYGERIGDRFAEMFAKISFTEKSFRK